MASPQAQEIINQLNNPFPPELLQQMDDALEVDKALQPFFVKAQEAGIDLTEEKRQVDAGIAQIRAAKAVFEQLQ